MKKILVCSLVSIILLAGCSLSKNGVIKVNDTMISKAEVDKAIDKELNSSPFKAFGGANNFVKSDDNFMYLIFKEKVVKELIVKTLIDSEISKRSISINDEDIKNEMKSIIDKVGSKEELNRILKQRGISNSEFKGDLVEQIKIKKLVKSISNINITDADAKKYYDSNPDKFKHEEQVRASHILINSDLLQIIKSIKSKNKNISPTDLNTKIEKIQEEQKAKAEAILKEVKSNPDNFEKIARQKSEDKASGERGGELGFFTKDAMVPEFSKVAFSMKPNTISDSLVKTNYGYHIIKVTDRTEPGVIPFTKVKDEIKFYLETQEQVKVLKNLTEGLMKTAKIEYIDKSYDVDSLLKKNTSETKKLKE